MNDLMPVYSQPTVTLKHEGMRPTTLRRVGPVQMVVEATVSNGLVFRGGGLVVIVSRERTDRHGKLWHLSISHKHRYPTWDEIAAARYALLPAELDFMMVLPQVGDYVAVHPNCFHLWETPTEWGIQ